ncbi:uncharacterized protein STEHIDRAFT_141295 [Stereum hirsutum FP-91666 SS1]|uniref:uncharacterized protein n=1 Tax=Stereum hirsutum (strain FP-91666) TaxID=721885 RepID=UPI000444A417|nr:uncharacterized protein STEHIDRAFT_141295 [Stereum hirsutum FP-91666 SS1]EIM83597.1 hypothetical protein STEHIDRAFT_141295 [Stereum hirsutum FP-91666 SS1]
MSNTNRPDLSSDALWYERATLIGGLACWMTFGMICVVCLQTMHLLIEDPPRRGTKRNKTLIVFTLVMFSLAVAYAGSYARNYQLEFIDNRDYPGGPMAWGRTQYASGPLAAFNVIGVVISWLADGFLLYRCLAIFRFKYYLLISLVLVYLANIVFGIFFLWESMRPGASVYSNNTVDWGLAHMFLTAALNIILPTLIAGRLLLFRRRLREALEDSDALSAPYVSIAAMVIESSMICAVSSIVLAIPYALNSHVVNIVGPSSFLMPVLSTILINMRVALRRAWDSRTMAAASSCLSGPQRAMTSLEFVGTAQGLESFAEMEESGSADGRGLMGMTATREAVRGTEQEVISVVTKKCITRGKDMRSSSELVRVVKRRIDEEETTENTLAHSACGPTRHVFFLPLAMSILLYLFFGLFAIFLLFLNKKKSKALVTSTGTFSPTAKLCRPKENRDDCQVCSKTPEGDESLKRCSICKNRFYCSSRCQKRDWKKHKVDCSLLPSEPIELPISFVPVEELDAEVARSREMLGRVWNELEEAEKAGPLSKAQARELPVIKDLAAYTLSPSLTYPNPNSLPPLSHTTASITRLFFLHEIAHIRQKSSSDEDFAKALEPLETFFDTLQMPSDFPQLLGTKVVRRPGELSSGEYHILKQVIIMKMIPDNKESADKWYELLKVTKKVLN